MVNTAPVLDGLNSKVTFAENTINLGPQLIDVDVSFSDAENNFFPGSLTISGGLSEDVLGIRIRDSGPARSASSATPSPRSEEHTSEPSHSAKSRMPSSA